MTSDIKIIKELKQYFNLKFDMIKKEIFNHIKSMKNDVTTEINKNKKEIFNINTQFTKEKKIINDLIMENEKLKVDIEDFKKKFIKDIQNDIEYNILNNEKLILKIIEKFGE